MRTLDRKLRRDLARLKGPAVAIALIVACGVSSWVTVLMAYRGLKNTRDAYYRTYRMPDLFAPVKRAPSSVARRLEGLPDVRRVRARLVFDVTIDLPEVEAACFGRVQSVPDAGGDVVGDVHLARGAWFTGDGSRQTIIGDRFARARGLEPGDRIAAILNNRKESLTIVGTALSPEHVYMIRGTGELLPDPAHFTVLWLSTSFAESAFDFGDSANEFVATLAQGADLDRALDDFDRVLDRYGAYGAYAREDQLSNRYLSDEIEGLKGTATLVPAVFLGVAAFVLNMLLARLVRTQRTQIAVFRAFGFSTGAIARHYVRIALIVVGAGSVLGVALGLWFARAILEAYARFYQFPLLQFRFDPLVVFSGVGVSLLFGVLGAASAARRAARLDPAEGLRPEAPGTFRRTRLERWRGLWSRLGFVWRMVFRHVARARLRSALNVAGVALAASIVLLALFTEDSMDELIGFQDRWVDRHDVRVSFSTERGTSALYEIRRMPGVRRAEPELVVPVRLRNGHRERRVGIFGLPSDGTLRGLVDYDARPARRPSWGLLLTRKLGELLDVSRGDRLEVELLEGRKTVIQAPVEDLVDEYMGTGAYADLHRLSRWVGEEEALNAARLLVDPARAARLTRRLKDLPAVESVTNQAQTVQVFEETLAASMGIMTTVLTVFAGVIAFGVIYNAARIGLAERERTLASMRVLGFTRREVSSVVTWESLLLSAVAVPPGVGLGALFCLALARTYDTDLYRFPYVITARSLWLTAGAVLLFTLLANWALRRRIDRLDLVEALKSRE